MNVQTNAPVERSIPSATGREVSQPRVAILAAQLIVASFYGLLGLAVFAGYGAAFAVRCRACNAGIDRARFSGHGR